MFLQSSDLSWENIAEKLQFDISVIVRSTKTRFVASWYTGSKADTLSMKYQAQSTVLAAGCYPAVRCRTAVGKYFIRGVHH